MLNVIAVFIGGGIGAALRYLICTCSQKACSVSFPYHTLSVNVIGSFILGFLAYYFALKTSVPSHFKLFLTVGLCGGFTTFSTFSLESVNLFNEGRFFDLVLYILLSVMVCIIFAALGAYFAKYI